MQQTAENLFAQPEQQFASFEEMFNAMPIEMQHQLMEQFAQNPEMMPEGMEMALPEDAAPEVEVQIPYCREEPKVGRNDPCPCGSGKKYKKCCGRD